MAAFSAKLKTRATLTTIRPVLGALSDEGPLSSGGNSTRLQEKQRIREALHPQISRLWREHPALDEGPLWEELKAQKGLFPLGAFTFVPLVSRHLHLTCGLNLLFLRQERPGAIIHQGDIDNRLKVLFDALRMPKDIGETKGLTPTTKTRSLKMADKEYPPPFFCLLEDDSLITSVSVDTDQLLDKRKSQATRDVRLVMRVSVRLIRLTTSNMGFMGD